MFAEHVSPNLREILPVFFWESLRATRMIEVNQLRQPVFMLGIGGDAS